MDDQETVKHLRAQWTKPMLDKAWRDAMRQAMQGTPAFTDLVKEQEEVIEIFRPTIEKKLAKHFPQFYPAASDPEGEAKK